MTLKVEITRADYDKAVKMAGGDPKWAYADPHNCFLATCLRRLYPGKHVSIGGTIAQHDFKWYTIEQADKIKELITRPSSLPLKVTLTPQEAPGEE